MAELYDASGEMSTKYYPLIMIADTGFYPVEHFETKGRTIEEAAKAHGEINAHVNRVEDINGKVLWERTKQ